MSDAPIPVLDIAALFGGPCRERDATDARLLHVARDMGFLAITGLPHDVPVGSDARRELLRIFELLPGERQRLWRRKFAPENPNIYRGWFPVQAGNVTSKEGIDLGGDIAHGTDVVIAGDPLREVTPLPPPTRLPGWQQSCAAYYAAMERVSTALIHALARGLGIAENHFDPFFHRGLSTLRLISYPVRAPDELALCADPAVWVEHAGDRRYVTGAPHTDSGFITLLAQDGVPGLQARTSAGAWVDVPPLDRALAVNFGQVLERWCQGCIRATEHRVLGTGHARQSIPFFYEARADALIRPLWVDRPQPFEPFVFGDYLWARITKFVEFHGMADERRPGGS